MSFNQQKGNLDADSFAELHGRYRSRLLNSVTGIVRDRATAEDITDAAFATAFEKRHDFRGEAAAYTWLYRIAVNQARDPRRRNRAVSLDSLTSEPEALVECDMTADALERSEFRLKLRKTLRKIPTVYRRVLLDHFVCRQGPELLCLGQS